MISVSPVETPPVLSPVETCSGSYEHDWVDVNTVSPYLDVVFKQQKVSPQADLHSASVVQVETVAYWRVAANNIESNVSLTAEFIFILFIIYYSRYSMSTLYTSILLRPLN